jgi:AraC-like DNA-binding protein
VRDEARKALLAGTPADGASWQQRVGAYTRLPDLIRSLGADPGSVLAEAGLGPNALAAPDQTVPYPAIGRLLDAAAARTGCGHFGLLAGRLWRLEDLGLLGEAVRHSPTVGEALRTLAVHQHLNSGGGLAFLIERDTHVDLGYAIYHPDVVRTDQVYDAVLAAGVRFLRELAGDTFAPSEVLLPHRRPLDARAYRSAFHHAARYDADIAALRFPAGWMQRPVAAADPARRAAALRQIGTQLRGELVPRAMRALRLLMLHGDVSGESTARMLAMHRRTLNRRLKAQGTTFQFMLDRVRFGVARQLLESTGMTLDDVAAALGYTSVSPFMRSFRRWTGTTPGRWRREPRPVAPQAAAGASRTRPAPRDDEAANAA